MQIVFTSVEYLDSFWAALDEVARERRYLCFLKAPQKEDAEKFIEEIMAKQWTQYFAIDEGRVVGWCDITRNELEGFTHAGQLGMGVIPSHRRQGIGKRLIVAAIEDVFSKGLERIQLDVFASNRAAIALYEKLGFKVEGLRRKARFIDGAYDDLQTMGLLKDDYK